MESPFIIQTAKDYDVPVEVVKRIYDKYGSTSMLYEKLEEYLKQRSAQ